MKVPIHPNVTTSRKLETCKNRVVQFNGDNNYYLVLPSECITAIFGEQKGMMFLYSFSTGEIYSDWVDSTVKAVFDIENLELKNA